MKTLLILLSTIYVLTILLGCATPRTRSTDPAMRIAVATDNANSYAEIQTALMENGKFELIDRQNGLQASMAEQDFNQGYRVDQKERYARMGRLYGVGAVLVANVSCVPHTTFFAGLSSPSADCVEHLSLIATSTGQVIASSRAEANVAVDMIWNKPPNPSWQEAVDKLSDNFPSHFEKRNYSDKMKSFRKGEIDDVNEEAE